MAYTKNWYKNNPHPKGMLGKIPWNKGLKDYNAGEKHPFYKSHHKKGSKNKISKTMKRIWQEKDWTERNKKVSKWRESGQYAEKNPNWKGNNVGYDGLHSWVYRQLGKASKCSKDENHKSTRYHWANISRKYKRQLDDWISLCPSCHLKADRRKTSLEASLGVSSTEGGDVLA